jgi:uncharacterized protein
MAPRRALLALALALALVAGCGRGDEPPSGRPPTVEHDVVTAVPSGPAAPAAAVVLHPPGRPPVRVAVELAISPREIQRGLMYREHLPPDGGMLFVFRSEKRQSFWMKNTLIPLDMIFVTADRVVAGVVANAEPRTLTSRAVEAESQFVLEVNAGWAAANGIVAGTPVSFENVPVERATVD